MKISRRAALTAGSLGVVAAGAGAVTLANREKPEPPAPPVLDKNDRLLWRNWSGIQHAYPAQRAAPASEDELAALLPKAPGPIRAVGAGHSFTALVPTDGTLVSLDNLAGVAGWDGDVAQVWAGTRLGALGPALAEMGRAMPGLPDINKQSLGGAMGTATHGAGKAIPAIHAEAQSLRLATVTGEVIEASPTKNPEIFQAAKVSMGALGVITQAKLATAANRRLHRRVWVEDFESACDQAEARWAKHRNFEFYAVPFTGLAANISHDETDEAARPRGPDTDSGFLEVLRSCRNLLAFSTPLRKAAAHALLSTAKPEEAVDEGWKLLSTERPVRFNEMEYHLPPEAQIPALKEVVATIEKHRPDVFFPIEVRRIAADDAWLSPFNAGPRGSVAVHCHYKDQYGFMFELIEPIFRRHGGRPHWGKLHSLGAADFAALYPRWKDFLEVRRELDPEGRLLNPFLHKVFGV